MERTTSMLTTRSEKPEGNSVIELRVLVGNVTITLLVVIP